MRQIKGYNLDTEGKQQLQPHLSTSELIACQPEASDRFRRFISRCQVAKVECDGREFGHIELAGISESGTMIHLRRAEGLATDTHENDFLLEIGSAHDELQIATVRTVRELRDGDGASLHILCETPDRSFVIELSQRRCVLQDLMSGSDDHIMHYLEMLNRAEAVRLDLR